jgi:phosphoribosylglycinamide formyltransferase 1
MLLYTKTKIAILISGAGTNMAALLYAAKDPACPYEVALVASNNPASEGLALAAAEGLPTFALTHKGVSREDHDAAMQNAITAAKADTVVLAGYMRILTDGFVTAWEGRMLNIHPSLLPKYKGLDTHQRALDAGDRLGGCSVHLVTPELDDGPVLGQIEVTILPDDTAETLARRVQIAEHQLYPRTLAAYVTRELSTDWLIERVATLALALPETSYRESHGSPAWRVGPDSSGKFFAYVSVNHHGDDRTALLVKCSGPDEMAALIEQDPEIYHRPAYYGASGWIGVRLDRVGVDWRHIGEWMEPSWASVAPKRLTKLMDVAGEF